jgi:hypothetical protein
MDSVVSAWLVRKAMLACKSSSRKETIGTTIWERTEAAVVEGSSSLAFFFDAVLDGDFLARLGDLLGFLT